MDNMCHNLFTHPRNSPDQPNKKGVEGSSDIVNSLTTLSKWRLAVAVFRTGNTAACSSVGGLSMDLRELCDMMVVYSAKEVGIAVHCPAKME
jgi:hypothetical protein